MRGSPFFFPPLLSNSPPRPSPVFNGTRQTQNRSLQVEHRSLRSSDLCSALSMLAPPPCVMFLFISHHFPPPARFWSFLFFPRILAGSLPFPQARRQIYTGATSEITYSRLFRVLMLHTVFRSSPSPRTPPPSSYSRTIFRRQRLWSCLPEYHPPRARQEKAVASSPAHPLPRGPKRPYFLRTIRVMRQTQALLRMKKHIHQADRITTYCRLPSSDFHFPVRVNPFDGVGPSRHPIHPPSCFIDLFL